MAMKGFSPDQLTALERSLLEGQAKGVRFSLADVRSEMRRRQKHRFDPREVASTILAQTASSEDGRTTYGELWKSLTGGQPWKGNSPRTIMARELGHVLAYCHQNGLPMLTVLVVTQSERALTDAAINNICDECLEMGIDVGPDRRAFVERQATESLRVVAARLPES